MIPHRTVMIEREFTVASNAFSAAPSRFACDRVKRVVVVEEESIELGSRCWVFAGK